MGQAFLKTIRGCLVLFAFITFVITVHAVRLYEIPISEPKTWPTWLPLFLAIFSLIAYSWALKAQKEQRNIIQLNAARYTSSLLLCIAWLVSPSYVVNRILSYLRRYNSTDQFFELWNCDSPGCGLGLAIDLFGFFMAFFVFVEVILAYLYERSTNVHGANARPASIVIGPAPVPQQQQSPVHQYPYDPAQPVHQQYAFAPVVQQPGQPVAYYPQPAMAVPYQSPTMPYQQGPTTPYQVATTPHQVIQMAPTHQPYPTSPTQ
ncbi:MAG: hypothetical protein J3Q66DRAFT_412606 [Benniella sp.]|nr:MAG: hypothetical protein J3Q66DRAFT_412606 [Benniella sp.]